MINQYAMSNQFSFKIFSNDLAIDLGTANLLVYSAGEGIVYNEPCVVAVGNDNFGRRKVLAVGTEAKNMIGRTPDKIKAIRPLRNGVIADFEIAQEMLKIIIKKISKKSIFKPRIVICVPHEITEVEKRAVKESAELAGAREVFLLEEPIAAAIGAGLPITEACGSMIIDIGGGTTEIAIISMKGIVYSESVRVGGDSMDEAIHNYVRRQFNMLIGERTAEQIKISIGSAMPNGEECDLEIRGRDLLQGVPKTATINSIQVREALWEPVNQILEAIRSALEKTPPELASDIVDRGITMTGGGSLLKNLDIIISQKTGLNVVLVDNPLETVVLGSGAILSRTELLKELMIQ